MARWCPRCGAEYVEGWGTCSDCGVELGDRPPSEPAEPFGPEDAIFIEPRAARRHSDPFIAIWEGPTPEGETLAARLGAAHIPVDLGEALEVGHVRVQVPRSYVDEAYAALDAAHASPLPHPGLNGEGEARAAARERWVRFGVAVLALALAAILVLTML